MKRALLVLALTLAGCASAEPIATFPGHCYRGDLGCAVVSSDGFAVAFGRDLILVGPSHDERFAGVMDARIGYPGFTASSSDGSVVAWSDNDAAVKVRDRRTGVLRTLVEGVRRLRVSTADSLPYVPVALSPDGTRVAWSEERAVRVLALPEAEDVASLPLRAGASVLAFSPDGTKLACGVFADNAPGELVVFDLRTKRLVLRDRQAFGPSFPGTLLFSADGARLGVMDGGSSLVLYSLAEPGAKALTDLEGVDARGLALELNERATALALAADGRRFEGSADGSIRILEPLAGRDVGHFPALASRVSLLRLSRDERLLLVGAADTLALHDARTGALLRVIAPPVSQVTRVEHRGSVLRVEHATGTIATLDRRTKAVLAVERRAAPSNPGWAFDRDGTLEAERIPGQGIRVRETETGRRLWERAAETPRAMAFSPDAELLALSGDYGDLRLVDARTGELRVTLKEPSAGGTAITALGFSPDGRELACGRDDGSVLIYALPRRER